MSKGTVLSEARTILVRLGTCDSYRTDSPYNDYEDVSFKDRCFYKGYGLNIEASFKSSNGVETDSEIRAKIAREGDVSISFADELVFGGGVYRPGRWEEVLHMLFNKLPAVGAEMKNTKAAEEKICSLLDSYGYLAGISVDKLLIKRCIVWTSKSGSEGDVETYNMCYFTRHKVSKNGTTVLDLKFYGKEYDSRNRRHYYKYETFVLKPGSWLDEWKECLEAEKRMREQNKASHSASMAEKYLGILDRK